MMALFEAQRVNLLPFSARIEDGRGLIRRSSSSVDTSGIVHTLRWRYDSEIVQPGVSLGG
jgi:hypothetical protein